MPIVSAERISALATEVLRRTVVLPATVARVPNADYSGSGGTVIVRVPQRRTATEVSGSLSYGSIDETPVEVDVARWYDGVSLTPDMTTLEIVEFGRQVIAPMTAAIAEAGESILADVMNAVEPVADWTDLEDAESTRDDVLAIREALTTNDVPGANRTLAVAPDVATAILRIDGFVKVNEAGTAEALRDAMIGRLFGMDVIESNALAAGSGLGYHRSAFCLATLSPALPQGGASAAAATVDGIALRTVLAYSTSNGGDVILLDTFGGASLVDADRVVRYGEEESG